MVKRKIKSPEAGVVERALEQKMRVLLKRFDDLHAEIANARREVAEFRSHLDAKFQRTHELIHKLNLRVNTVETQVDMFMDFARRAADKADNRFECLVRVEEGLKLHRRAG
jgi:hypothetical protein